MERAKVPGPSDSRHCKRNDFNFLNWMTTWLSILIICSRQLNKIRLFTTKSFQAQSWLLTASLMPRLWSRRSDEGFCCFGLCFCVSGVTGSHLWRSQAEFEASDTDFFAKIARAGPLSVQLQSTWVDSNSACQLGRQLYSITRCEFFYWFFRKIEFFFNLNGSDENVLIFANRRMTSVILLKSFRLGNMTQERSMLWGFWGNLVKKAFLSVMMDL